jgi:hypothetical protein
MHDIDTSPQTAQLHSREQERGEEKKQNSAPGMENTSLTLDLYPIAEYMAPPG